MIDYRTLCVWQCIAEYAGAHNTSVSISTICESCVERIGMNGAFLTSGDPPQERVYTTDPRASHVVDLHFLHGQGPGLDAARIGRPVHAPDLGSSACLLAWPVFTRSALSAGIRALIAVPLLVGQVVIGLFGLYSCDPVVLHEERRREVSVFAEVALGLMLDGQSTPPGDSARWLAVDAVVHQASGIIAAQLDVDIDESLDRLRAHALAHGRPLLEIAREVVARRLRFRPIPETGPNNAPNS